jgi:hypothetical protein
MAKVMENLFQQNSSTIIFNQFSTFFKTSVNRIGILAQKCSYSIKKSPLFRGLQTFAKQ